MAYNANYYNNGMRYQGQNMQRRQGYPVQQPAGAPNTVRNAAPNPANVQCNQCNPEPACQTEREPVDSMALTMAYVPWQPWCDVYDLEEGYCRGTIFPNLDKPFKGAMFL